MRFAAAVVAMVTLAWASGAAADPVTYQCINLGSNSFALVDETVSPAEYNPDSNEPALVIDWEAKHLQLGSGAGMPMIANDQAVIGILQAVSPAEGDQPGQVVLGTLVLNRATGRISANIHIQFGDGSLVAVQAAYQCRTAAGATAF